MNLKGDENAKDKEKKGKWRLSSLLHPKDHSPSPIDQPANSTSETLNSDSAYGSSVQNSSTGVPTISDSQAKAQDAELKTKTDESSGRTVTTTTTTTTTTVTTTTGDHFQVPPGEEVVVTQGAPNNNPVELSARPVSQGSGSATANSQHGLNPSVKDRRRRSQSPSALGIQPSHGEHLSPLERPPVSPTQRQNFSYPARTPTGSQTQLSYDSMHPAHRPRPPNNNSLHPQPQQQYQPYSPGAARPEAYDGLRQHSQQQLAPPDRSNYGYGPLSPATGGRLSNSDHVGPDAVPQPPSRTAVQGLKTAAAGIHGASEALRGSVNAAVARRTGAPPEVVASHEAVIAKGRQEIETGRFYRNDQVPPSTNGNFSAGPSAYENANGHAGPAAISPGGQQPSDVGFSRVHPTTTNTSRHSVENSANGVLSQVGSAPAGTPGKPLAAKQDGPRKKGVLKKVLKKRNDGVTV